MVTLKERSDNWGATSLIVRDHRHDKGDGYEETPHKKISKKESPRKKPGCPGNNGKNHVYVWIGARFTPSPNGRYFDQAMGEAAYRSHPNYIREFRTWSPFDSRAEHIAWLEKREIQICAGCLKKPGKTRMKENEAPDKTWWT